MPGSHSCSLPAAFKRVGLGLLGATEGAKGRALKAPRDICAIAAMLNALCETAGAQLCLKVLSALCEISEPIS